MNDNPIMTIIQRAVSDFGFRQVVLYDFENINNSLQEGERLSAELLEKTKATLIPEIAQLPVPVEPSDREHVINAIYKKLGVK